MPLARHDVIFTSMHLVERFLLTCLLRGMTDARKKYSFTRTVSTHMPLARHDMYLSAGAGSQECFYSHASCEA